MTTSRLFFFFGKQLNASLSSDGQTESSSVTWDFGTDSRFVKTNHVFSKYIQTDCLWDFLTKREVLFFFPMLLINSMNSLCSKLAVNGVIMWFILKFQWHWKDAYVNYVCLFYVACQGKDKQGTFVYQARNCWRRTCCAYVCLLWMIRYKVWLLWWDKQLSLPRMISRLHNRCHPVIFMFSQIYIHVYKVVVYIREAVTKFPEL